MALGNLSKSDRRKEADPEALKALENGAPLKPTEPVSSQAVFKRYNFSLTKAVSDDIDTLTLIPRQFRANRSDVIKAGVLALRRMPEEDLVSLLAEVTGNN